VIAAFAVVLIVVITVAALKANSNNGSGSSGTLASTDVVNRVTKVTQAVTDAVAGGSVSALPKLIKAPALMSGTKPLVVYVGAEFCPYCATERWPMVVALSRFGTFSNLHTTHSSGTDVYPNTQTFSFHGTTYTSQYIDFQGIETLSNVPSGTSYETLDTPTTDQEALVNTYDAAPYVDAASAGSIPFVDFGGKYIISGSSYSPQVLQGKSLDDISSALGNANDPVTQGVVGTANVITAAICSLTSNQPTSVCSDPTIQGLEVTLNGQTAVGQ